MDAKTLAIVTARASAQLFAAQGLRGDKQARALFGIANAIESGAEVDAHMATVADALKEGAAPDWDDVHARISGEADELRNRNTGDPNA